MLKSVNLLEFTFYHSFQIFYHEKILAYTRMMVWIPGWLLENANGQLTDRIRKSVIKLFKEIGFKVEMETNLKIVNFLDITFNQASTKYRPYRKPNGNLMYIQKALKDRARKEQRKKNNRNRKVICFNPHIASKSAPTLPNVFLTSCINIFLNNLDYRKSLIEIMLG